MPKRKPPNRRSGAAKALRSPALRARGAEQTHLQTQQEGS